MLEVSLAVLDEAKGGHNVEGCAVDDGLNAIGFAVIVDPGGEIKDNKFEISLFFSDESFLLDDSLTGAFGCERSSGNDIRILLLIYFVRTNYN